MHPLKGNIVSSHQIFPVQHQFSRTRRSLYHILHTNSPQVGPTFIYFLTPHRPPLHSSTTLDLTLATASLPPPAAPPSPSSRRALHLPHVLFRRRARHIPHAGGAVATLRGMGGGEEAVGDRGESAWAGDAGAVADFLRAGAEDAARKSSTSLSRTTAEQGWPGWLRPRGCAAEEGPRAGDGLRGRPAPFLPPSAGKPAAASDPAPQCSWRKRPCRGCASAPPMADLDGRCSSR
jgi:hypothetical protein